MGRDNNQPHSGKALTNESNYPYIVEFAVAAGELDVELSRQIIGFHKSRQMSRDMDAGLLREVKAIFGGAFPIW